MVNEMTTYSTEQPPLTWNTLLEVKERVEGLRYKFRLPKLEQELDMCDYELREVEGMYLLHRKASPDWGNDFYSLPKFHPAHFILLDGATPELAKELLAMFPCLSPRETGN